ncbi:MAG: GNAT family N-acetyltransferase [Candidatus Izemoplasmatales bacterium]|nr:GNAT family N-acetyltransferase [Candidatus Izemoplasmatales bacterium]MDD5293239.1 GNAT family N-acetyltransferase [Candidatus Izemoplasmatales bacterium]
MKITPYLSARLMLEDCESFLLENKYMNNLMLGILHRIKDDEVTYGDLYLKVEDGTHALVLCMSGLYLILYANSVADAIYEAAVNYLIDHKVEFPGIVGPVDMCEAFKMAYTKITHKTMRVHMNQRIYVNTTLIKASRLKGDIEMPRNADRPILKQWMSDFYIMVGEKPSEDIVEKKLMDIIDHQSLFVYRHHGEIVTMAGFSRPFKQTVSLAYVYTPEKHRGKGFATHCVERLTEWLLARYEGVTLYTDLSNPVSNNIYQKIGYRPVGDSVVYTVSQTDSVDQS